MTLQQLLYYVPYNPTVVRKSDGYTFTLDMQNAYVMEREGLHLYRLELKALRDIPEHGLSGLTYKPDGYYYNGNWLSRSVHMLPMLLFERLIFNHYDVFKLND
jgi:hypothetical protein